MVTLKQLPILSLGLLLTTLSGQAQALPGQSVAEVSAWIQAHPTLQPASGETLLVRKSETAAQRFSFEASLLAPGRAAPSGNPGTISREQITIFDVINGVSRDRLEESLRAIYGPDLYQDYAAATVVYEYPTAENLIQAQNQGAPLLEAIQGEIRRGDRYAYWVETAQSRTGVAYTGQITVFRLDDIEKLEIEMRERA